MCNGSEPQSLPEGECERNSSCEYVHDTYTPSGHYCVVNSEKKHEVDFVTGLVSRSWILAVTIGVGYFLSYLYLVLLAFFAAVIIWSMIIIFIILGVILGIVFIIIGIAFISRDESSIVFIMVGIVVFIIVSVLGCIVCCCRRRISLCIELIREAGKAIRAIPCVTCVPITFTLLVGGISVVVVRVFFFILFFFFLFCFLIFNKGVGEIFYISSLPITLSGGMREITIPGYSV
jgi:hypothetical protein